MITQQSVKEQEQWLVQKGFELRDGENEEDSGVMKQARVLYEVWSIWEAERNPDKECLSNEAKWHWDYDFYKWAKTYTKRRAGHLPAKETIDNKIAVYRDYIAEQLIEAPEYVFIPKRDEFGQLVDPALEDENAWEKIVPDFKNTDHGKLLVAKGTAKRGEMSPEAWSAVFDPYASVETLRQALGKVPSNNNPPPEDDFYLFEQDGIIYGCQNGNMKAVFQVLFENDEGDELFRRTLCHILQAAGIHVPLSYKSK